MLKRYVCNRYKELRVAKGAAFRNGFFETDNEKLQNLIETSESWKSGHISYQDPPEVMAEKAEEENAAQQQGAYRTDKSQNATRKMAAKLGLSDKQTEKLVKERTEITRQVEAAALARKRGEIQ